jgi:starch-binding outer membrane protein, SusD/RagB family
MKASRSMRTAARRAVVTGVVAVLLAACSSLLDVKDPDVIDPGDVQNADGAVGAYNGGIGDFAFANDGDNGGTEGQILVSGVMSDEYTDVETFPTRIEYDSRAIDERNTTLRDVYFNLHKARVALEGAAGALQQYAPTPNSRIGEVLALAGFSYVYFAENYCSAVPFSERLPDGTIQNGMPLSTKAILARALSRFDSALAVTATQSSSSDSVARLRVRNLAAVGRGRALLDSGDFAGAAAAIAAVPTSFVYSTFHSTATDRQKNGVFVFNNQAPLGTARFSVADVEGTNGLNFLSAADPRVVAPQNGKGFDNASPLFVLSKYASQTSPVHVADGVEARLIAAEAQLQAGDGPGMVTSLNALRADATNNGGFTLAALADPGTQVGREDLLFRERAFWLFATGHRLGDLRRLARAPYNRAVNTIYPIGTYTHTNTVYGNNTEIPVTFDERNNPNFTGCDYNTP